MIWAAWARVCVSVCVCDLRRLERDLGWLVRDPWRLGRGLGQLSRALG